MKRASLKTSPIHFIIFLSVVLTLTTKITLVKELLYIGFFVPTVYIAVHFVRQGKFSTDLASLLCYFLIILAFIQCFNPNSNSIHSGLAITTTKYLPLLLIPLLATRPTNQASIQRLAKFLIGIAVVSALYSILCFAIGYPHFETQWAYALGNVHGLDVWTHEQRRPFGLFLYSADNAIFLSIAFILLLLKPYRPLTNYTIGLLFLVTLVLLGTRTVWLSITCAICIFIIFSSEKIMKKSLYVLLISLASILIFYFTKIYDLSTFERLARIPDFSNDGSIIGRYSIWGMIYQLNPTQLIFGMGTGFFRDVQTQNSLLLADNMYLNLLVTTGCFGLIAFALLLTWPLLQMARASTSQTDKHIKNTLVVLMAITVNFSVIFITGDHLQTYPINVLFAIVTGLSIAMYLQLRRNP